MIYNIELIDNHIVIVEDGLRFLIDTGSPVTISNHATISLFGVRVNAQQNIIGHTSIDDINRSIPKANLDALIGVDILNKISFSISLSNKLLKLNPVINHNEYNEFSLSNFMEIPIVVLMICGKEVNFFLDTGAKISYLNSNFVKDQQPIRVEQDFYPGFGDFETSIFQIQAELFYQLKKHDFGVLPESLESSLSVGGTNGIIGNNILLNFDMVIDNIQNKIFVKK
tara:strand:- start:997 stop:1674 length:678 start_codon:yes stop_codon:yes gene_type:complete